MRAHTMLAAGLIVLTPALAWANPFEGETALAPDVLEAKRGGTETSISGSLLQGNDSNLSGTNTGNIGVGSGGTKYTGLISPAQVNGNSGITAVMQNTGDLVNMNNATSVNVYMR